jgi:hypothetical protein
MSTFVVGVTRIGYGYRDFEIEAETSEEAREKALDIAGNFEFNEKTSDYEISGVIPKTDEPVTNDIAQLTDALIDDCQDTCSTDSGYLRSVLRCYFESMGDEEIRKRHNDAFGSY